MADINLWSPLFEERVTVELGKEQLASIVEFLRTGKDEAYPAWPLWIADMLEGKRPFPPRRIVPASAEE